MAKEGQIVRYHNDFNKIRLPNFTAQEQNILMSIICKINDNQSEEIIFTPEELQKFSTQNFTQTELYDVIKLLKDKFFGAHFEILLTVEEKGVIYKDHGIINLFTDFYIRTKEQDTKIEHVRLKVNPRFAYLIHELVGNFTHFELEEFIGLSSKYAKSLYRLLKQFKNTGICTIYQNDWQGFMEIMNIPKDWNHSNIDERILKPAIKELTAERTVGLEKRILFKYLTYKKVKRGGNKVVGITFDFLPAMGRRRLERINLRAALKSYIGKVIPVSIDNAPTKPHEIIKMGLKANSEIQFAIKDPETGNIYSDVFPNLEAIKEQFNLALAKKPTNAAQQSTNAAKNKKALVKSISRTIINKAHKTQRYKWNIEMIKDVYSDKPLYIGDKEYRLFDARIEVYHGTEYLIMVLKSPENKRDKKLSLTFESYDELFEFVDSRKG